MQSQVTPVPSERMVMPTVISQLFTYEKKNRYTSFFLLVEIIIDWLMQ